MPWARTRQRGPKPAEPGPAAAFWAGRTRSTRSGFGRGADVKESAMDQVGQQLPPLGMELFPRTVNEAVLGKLDRRKITQDAGGTAAERAAPAA